MVDEVQPSQPNGQSAANQVNRYAVVVGVNDYSEARITGLSYCAADAEAIYDGLLAYCQYDPQHVVLFTDGNHNDARKPLRSDILAATASMCKRAAKNDSILFFFAGHGTHDDSDSYLLTKDFRFDVIADTSIPMNLLNEYTRKSKARFKMRFFDACHSGRMGMRGLPAGPNIQEHLLIEAEGWATLSACKEEEYAHEDDELGHGIFSYCLLKGLSGEAATVDQKVTLHSLVTYTIANTIEITKDRGLQQTPVYAGNYAGDPTLATACSVSAAQVPQALVKVQETPIDALKPSPAKVPQIVDAIRSTLQNNPIRRDYVAPSQQEKLALGRELIQKVYDWCQEQEREYHEHIQDVATITVKRQSLQSCPLNHQLMKYIQDSDVKQAMELRLLYRTETVAPKLWPVNIFNYETREVLDGIGDKVGYYESSVLLKINIREPLSPVCALVVSVVPATFGLYLLAYFCSTELGEKQDEYWNSKTFSVRTLRALLFTDKDGELILRELQDLFPKFISFFSESYSARRAYLEKIGVSGQSLV